MESIVLNGKSPIYKWMNPHPRAAAAAEKQIPISQIPISQIPISQIPISYN